MCSFLSLNHLILFSNSYICNIITHLTTLGPKLFFVLYCACAPLLTQHQIFDNFRSKAVQMLRAMATFTNMD